MIFGDTCHLVKLSECLSIINISSMKVQVCVISLILGIITTHAFAAVTVPERTDVSVLNDGLATGEAQQNLLLSEEGLDANALQAPLNKEYKLEYFARASWYNAWLSCLSCGMRLASITSQAEQDAVVNLIKEYKLAGADLWIAGNDIATEGRFNWFTSGELFRYTNWATGQPDNNGGNEHCVQIRGGTFNQMWNDSPCSLALFYICEKSAECF